MVSFPNLPNLPGVPAIGRLVGAQLPLPISELADAVGLSGFLTPRWGIFDQSGNVVLLGDAVQSVEFQVEHRISDFPIERGSFASYNKVQTPFATKVGFMIGGFESDRAKFLSQVDAAVLSLNLYNVVTPEATYTGVNLTHYDYSRTAERGAANLRVDVWCEEIRIATNAKFTKTQLPAGADPVDEGQQQAGKPTSAQAGAVPTDPLSKGADGSLSTVPATQAAAGTGPSGIGSNGAGASNPNIIDTYRADGTPSGFRDLSFKDNNISIGTPKFDVTGTQVSGLGFVAK